MRYGFNKFQSASNNHILNLKELKKARNIKNNNIYNKINIKVTGDYE